MNDKSDSSYSQRLAPGDSESPAWSSEDDLSRNRAYDSRGEQQSSLRFAALQSYGLAFLSVAIAVVRRCSWSPRISVTRRFLCCCLQSL